MQIGLELFKFKPHFHVLRIGCAWIAELAAMSDELGDFTE
jgi:hypothetical protein